MIPRRSADMEQEEKEEKLSTAEAAKDEDSGGDGGGGGGRDHHGQGHWPNSQLRRAPNTFGDHRLSLGRASSPAPPSWHLGRAL